MEGLIEELELGAEVLLAVEDVTVPAGELQSHRQDLCHQGQVTIKMGLQVVLQLQFNLKRIRSKNTKHLILWNRHPKRRKASVVSSVRMVTSRTSVRC